MVSHFSWIHHLALLTLFNFAEISGLVQRSIHIVERSIKPALGQGTFEGPDDDESSTMPTLLLLAGKHYPN